MMRLAALIHGLGLRVARGDGAIAPCELVEDSRRVCPGSAFIARAGNAADGRTFIPDALTRGAAAIITDIDPPADLPRRVAWVRADRLDTPLVATLGERFFNHPSRALKLVGVTGTNGKTTTATLIHHLLNNAGVPAGLIGTLGVQVSSSRFQVSGSQTPPDREQPETCNLKLEIPLTTPGPIDLSRTLAAMRDEGCRAAVMEVSSHALAQGRVDALAFDVAVFTNLTGDHLDYHGSMNAYAAAKAKLFAMLDAQTSWAVVNGDDAHTPRMLEAFTGPPSHVLRCSVQPSDPPPSEGGVRGGCSALASSFPQQSNPRHNDSAAAHPLPASPSEGEGPRAGFAGAPSDPLPSEGGCDGECRAVPLALTADGSRARFDGPWGAVEAALPLVGRHNLANALQAIAAAHAITDLSGTLAHALARCPQIPGRLEKVSGSSDKPHGENLQPGTCNLKLPTVLVDYAHTHDALENVLSALRPVTRGRLLVVFGCGGDRDRTKRPKMAQVACRLADRVWITSDNPRTEDPRRIIDDVLGGLPIAAVIESLCRELGLEAPSWVHDVPPAPEPWFVSGMQSLRAIALAESPLPFRMRRIFVLENFLSRA